MTRFIAILAIILWVGSAIVYGVLYFKSRPQMNAAERVEIIVSPEERKFVLKEMRMMLESLQGIVMALEAKDMSSLGEAAGSSGAVVLRALPPSLMVKVPSEFRALAKESLDIFGNIKNSAASGAGEDKIIALLSEQLGVCTACHDTYRFVQNGR